jgi:multidrug resistance efflux pump
MTPEQIQAWAREADTTQGFYSESDYDAYLMRLCELARADLEAENADLRLRAGNGYSAKIESLIAEREALRAEVESLKADAARYKWVRQADPMRVERILDATGSCQATDAAIDAAMKGTL